MVGSVVLINCATCSPTLGKGHGRVALKAAKPHLVARLTEFRAKLEVHQKEVETDFRQ